MFKYLTDYRRKDNNIKLSKLLNVPFKELEDVFKTVEDWRSVDKAEGYVLDEIGREVGQLRRGTTDEVYRILIKARILSNNSKGDLFSVIRVMSSVLNIDESEFSITESYVDDIEKTGMVLIEKVPIKALTESGLKTEEFTELVKATLAAGVGIERLELTGTFEFVQELIQGDQHGFADIEQTTGGTLGAVFGDERGRKYGL